MRLEERLRRVAESEEAVGAFFAALPPAVADVLRTFPRDPDIAIYSIYPASIVSIRDLNKRRADEILRERFSATLGPPPHDETAIGGLLFASGARTVAFAESGHGEHYERFTKAHELGHLWLEFVLARLLGTPVSPVLAFRCEPADAPDSPDAPCRTEAAAGYSENETKANSFGASYLMPEGEVVRLYDKARAESDFSWWETAQSMCSRFNVSEWAMGYRLWELGKLKWEQYQQLKRTSMVKADMIDDPTQVYIDPDPSY